jgi:hypothetical protein
LKPTHAAELRPPTSKQPELSLKFDFNPYQATKQNPLRNPHDTLLRPQLAWQEMTKREALSGRAELQETNT